MSWEYAPAPAFSPSRDPEYLTEGGEIAAVARLLGLELMPWQRHVVDIATEYKPGPDGERLYHYRTVVVSVPRQSGKSTLMTPVRLHRIMTRPRIHAFSTAQTGKAARDRIMDMIERVEASPLAPLFKSIRSNGAEGLKVKDNGSSVIRFSPVTGALHGETPWLVDLDEIWKYPEETGDMLLGGARPAMITLGAKAQVWMVSTKGTMASTFMNRFVEAGETGADPSLAYFAWQMPEGLDPDDPATWWTFHPALGNTINEEDLAAEMYSEGISRAERIRAYMNLMTVVTDAIIDPDTWETLNTEPAGPRPDLSEVAVGVEIAAGNTCAAVVAAWRDAAGDPCVRVLHQAPGTTWLAPYLTMLHTDHGVDHVAADDAGPVRFLTDQLDPIEGETRPVIVPIKRLALKDRQTADATLMAAARDEHTLHHDGSTVLAQAVAAAQVTVRNGIARLDRDRSLGPIPSLIAASVALWDYDHQNETLEAVQLFT